MTAPLSLFLARFSVPPPSVFVDHEPPAPEPTVTLTEAELEARLEAAARCAKTEADRRHAAELAAMATANEAAVVETLDNARAAWAEAEGARLAGLVESRFGDLRMMIADGVASVLRPMLADAARSAIVQALTDALDRLLADSRQPTVRVCGPADLLEALRAARPSPGIEWVAAETVDVTVTAEATQIQTRLATALAAIAATEI